MRRSLLLCGLLACGGLVEAEPGGRDRDAGSRDARVDAGADAERCVEKLADKLIDHACTHGLGGPYADVVGLPTVADAASISRIHTAFRVTLEGGDAQNALGVATYRASRAREHVVLTKGVRSLTIAEDDGRELRATHTQKVAGCSAFDTATAFMLEQGKQYAVTLRGEREVLVFVEHVESFAQPWSPACPGQHGRP